MSNNVVYFFCNNIWCIDQTRDEISGNNARVFNIVTLPFNDKRLCDHTLKDFLILVILGL